MRGGAIRCFSAPHHPIGSSRSLALRQPPGRCAPLLCAPAARSRPFEPGAVRQNHQIAPAHALPVRCCRCAGRGEGGGGEGGTIIAFPGSILGYARRPLSTLAARSVPFDPGAARKSRLFAILRA